MSSFLHTHWRDEQAWKDEGLTFSMTSNEAVKMYDAALSQVVGYYTDPVVGGSDKALDLMLQADPGFVMGHVLCQNLELRCSPHINPTLHAKVNHLVRLAARRDVTTRERLHVQAVKQMALGNPAAACTIWEEILVHHPNDMLAIINAQNWYFHMGQHTQMRDNIARVLPRWKKTTPLYSYLHGMYAFGLEETNLFVEAEQHALKALELVPTDCVATHAQSHVLGSTDRHNEGIAFLSGTMDDWIQGTRLAGHNIWHWAVHHMEKGEHEAAVEIYDCHMAPRRCRHHDGSSILTDASSLLYRLQMQGVSVGDRWTDLLSYWTPFVDDHNLLYSDIHLLMCTLGAKDKDMTLKLMRSLRDYVRDSRGYNADVSRDVGVAICEAFIFADEGNFAEAVELLKPIRHKMISMGGSNQHRDIFNLFLIHAALQSSRNEHHNFARVVCVLAGTKETNWYDQLKADC